MNQNQRKRCSISRKLELEVLELYQLVMVRLIFIHSHFEEDESTLEKHRTKDESHMSYIYGDEDSQHHKLPEYSVELLAQAHGFQPQLGDLAELEDKNETEEPSVTEKDMESNTNTMIVNALANDADKHSSESLNKMTIKIYPPALQAVASRSPVESEKGHLKPI
eukprot:TRINITY_DN1451_c0_g1_i3.p2 TRINITY_DN1451_c0_g1~~TRINITY_DN1451_c0_g1_i3.p2  ORF type:complete len:165 (+),score=10.92 TRINITY_DN1451_c0_g1_i3:1111-1605(+)